MKFPCAKKISLLVEAVGCSTKFSKHTQSALFPFPIDVPMFSDSLSDIQLNVGRPLHSVNESRGEKKNVFEIHTRISGSFFLVGKRLLGSKGLALNLHSVPFPWRGLYS